MKLNLSNSLSYSRLVIAPIFLVLVIQPTAISVTLATVLICIGAVTDWLDGYVARTYKQETPHGRYIDPLADKALTSAAFIAFSWIGFMPWWMTITILARDVIVTIIRNVADSKGIEFRTSRKAKAKTFFQMSFIVYALALWLLSFVAWTPEIRADSLHLLYSDLTHGLELMMTGVTVYTLIDYLYDNRKLMAGGK